MTTYICTAKSGRKNCRAYKICYFLHDCHAWRHFIKYFNNLSPLYMKDVFKPAGQNTAVTWTYLFKFSQPLRKTNHGQRSSSYVVPCIWNKLPDFLKTTENINTFKYRVKKYFFRRMNNEENNIYS